MVALAQLSDIDLRLLRIFKAVVEAGGFAAAEVDLNISRSAISMAMSDLETRLGLRLCQRGRAGFAMTEAGSATYQAALQLLAALEGFRTQVNGLHQSLQGELNIGIADNLVTLPHMRITDALCSLKQRAPQVRINISMTTPTEIEKGLLDGRLQVGALPALRTLADLEYRPLYSEESRLYCSHQHPLFGATDSAAAEQLAHHDAVAPSYAQSPKVRAVYQGLNASATASDREGVAFLILTGCYIGYLPTHYAAQWIQQNRMRALAPGQCHFRTEYAAVTRRGGLHNPVLEAWLAALKVTA